MRAAMPSRQLAVRGVLLLGLFAAGVCGVAGGQAWKPFGTATEGFQVLLPGDPQVLESRVPAGADWFALRSYTAQAGSTAFYVGVCNYGSKGKVTDARAMLEAAKRGALEHMAARGLTERAIALGADPGLAFEAENGRMHFTVRMYLSGGVLYQAMVATPIGERFPDAHRFLDSFELLPASGSRADEPAPPSAWKAYRYANDGFAALFPHPPDLARKHISSYGDEFELRTYTTQDSSAALIAAVCDYGSRLADEVPEEMLDHAKLGVVSNMKAHTLSVEKMSLNDHPGLVFEAENATEHVSARMYVSGEMLYQVMVISPIEDRYLEAGRFLDSFDLFDVVRR